MRLLSAWLCTLTTVAGSLTLFTAARAQTSLPYQEPPKAFIDLVDTRPTPAVEVSPKDKSGRRWLLIETISGLPPISDLAQPEVRLAGLRLNPRTNGPSRGRYFTSLRLQALPGAGGVLQNVAVFLRRQDQDSDPVDSRRGRQ